MSGTCGSCSCVLCVSHVHSSSMIWIVRVLGVRQACAMSVFPAFAGVCYVFNVYAMLVVSVCCVLFSVYMVCVVFVPVSCV